MLNNMTLEIYGESHSRYIGCTVSGLPIGTKIDFENLEKFLNLRKSNSSINTQRKEEDKIIFIQGVENGTIFSNKISFVIENTNIKSHDYLKGIIRPGHADYIGYKKEGTKYKYQGGGKFSGRLTVLYVVVGAICSQLVKEEVYGHIYQINDLIDDDIKNVKIEKLKKIQTTFSVFNQDIKNKMLNYINQVQSEGDSVGAKLKFRIHKPVFGLGGHYFDSFESNLAANLFAIGAIKSIGFGMDDLYVSKKGSEVNDSYEVINEQVVSINNYQGGINGGFTNGFEDVIFSTIIRPTPSIFKKQKTVKFNGNNFENYDLLLKGRHDSFIANRIMIVIIAMTYITLFDLKKERYE